MMKKIIKILVLFVCLIGLNRSLNVSALDETWGPQERQTYTWNSPARTPTFNSITDNPALGDERNFVRVREYHEGYDNDIEDGLDDDFVDYVDIEPGKEYEVYVYYHNDASETFNTDGSGIAQNVRLKMEIPEELHNGDTAVIKGIISWGKDGNMQEVWDTAFLTAHDTVYLRYVSSSGAVIHNRGTANGSVLDKDALFDYGALLAYDSRYWGVIPGCNNFAGYITFRVKADQPKFFIEKEVSADGADDWNESIENVKPGDVLNFRIKYNNIGTTTQTSVRVKDVLPEGMTYVDETMLVVNPDYPGGVNVEDKIFRDGLVIGDYEPGEEAIIYYSVKLAENFDDCETTLYNDAHVATANGTEYDKVRVGVKKDNCGTSETTDEIVDTGPVEMTLALLIVLTVGVLSYYAIRTRILLKDTRNIVMKKK